jgi:hypothetical protein
MDIILPLIIILPVIIAHCKKKVNDSGLSPLLRKFEQKKNPAYNAIAPYAGFSFKNQL